MILCLAEGLITKMIHASARAKSSKHEPLVVVFVKLNIFQGYTVI